MFASEVQIFILTAIMIGCVKYVGDSPSLLELDIKT